MKTSLLIVIVIFVLGACSAPPKRQTLRDVDLPSKEKPTASAFGAPKSRDEIRRAYLDYLRHASKDDRSRVDALHRLAQLEFDVTENQGKTASGESVETLRDRRHDIATERTIELLQTLLRDHPDAKDNDKALYQLARAYDQRGMSDKSMEMLARLVSRYPKSPYFIESQFRLAEYWFIRGEYGKAEDLYTEILIGRDNATFREKTLYKRGWSRYKQGFYREAIDDFIAATNLNDFDDPSKLSDAKRNDFEEYFRAIGLAFIYMGAPDSLNQYFKANPGYRYIYHAYTRTGNLFLAQSRYSDAVRTLGEFNKLYPKSSHTPEVTLKIIDIWRNSGFSGNFVQTLEDFYAAYNPQSNYWSSQGVSPELRKAVGNSLKDYIVLASAHFHREYQASNKEADFIKAKTWYDRYLKHYSSSARKDNIPFLYAELLVQRGNHTEALAYYERAAFDGDIVVNKDAAYAAIATIARLHKQSTTSGGDQEQLVKLIHYSDLYVQLYRTDARSLAVAARAAQEAYRVGMYDKAIHIAEAFANAPYDADSYPLNVAKAHSYFKAERYPEAETAYLAMLQNHKLDGKEKSQMQDNLAVAIYQQATQAKTQNKLGDAVHHYVRISEVVPASDVAATGLYDGISIAYENKQWAEAAKYIERFQKLYPSHKFSRDASMKLSVAYMNTNQEGAAASELIKLARTDEKPDYKIAALWKAAELYESKRDFPSAIKAYEEYAANFQRPYPQYIEAMQKLAELSMKSASEGRANHWRQQILDADKRTPSNLKTDRTNYICSIAALSLAQSEYKQYSAIRLTLPLNRSLGHKKNALQKVLNLYGVATSYGVQETVTEATHSIGDVYYSFSKSLLESERPKGMSAIEQEQYKVLIEDQAFPFEDNAIKFYEKNILYTKQGIFDDWIQKSYAQLKLLFPARYNRDMMLEPYINVLH